MEGQTATAPLPATPGNFRANVAAGTSGSAPAPVPQAPVASPPATAPEPSQAQLPIAGADGSQGALERAAAEELARATGQQPPDPNAPADPGTKTVHGMSVDELVSALESGTLPDALADKIRQKVKLPAGRGPDGKFQSREAEITIEDLKRGYMMGQDYTRAQQENADFARRLDQERQALIGLFSGLDKPETFEQRMHDWGTADQARSMVTRSWGTAEQPNVEGFIKSVVGLGYGRVLQAALDYQADRYSQLVQRVRDPQVAMSIIQNEMDIQAQKAQLEREAERGKRAQAEVERQRLLQQRSAPQEDHSQMRAQIDGMRNAAFAQYGIPASGAVYDWFASNLRSAGAIAERSGEQVSLETLVARAARDTAQMLQSAGVQLQAVVPNGQNGQQQQAPSGLPARPTAAPVTSPIASNGSAIPGDDGTPAGFRARRAALDAMTRRR